MNCATVQCEQRGCAQLETNEHEGESPAVDAGVQQEEEEVDAEAEVRRR